MKTKIQTYRKGFIWGMIPVVLLAIALAITFQSCQREEDFAGLDGSYLKSTAILNPTLYWGQEKFVFYKGKPVTETKIIGSSDLEYFENNFVINIQNGDGTNNKVSSAIIKIDGVQIVGSIDFKKKPSTIKKGTFSLNLSSTIEVQVFGTPSSYIKVWIDGTLKPNLMKDIRDRHFYKTVTISTQVWMAENLAYLPSVSPPYENNILNDPPTDNPYYYVYGYSGNTVDVAKATTNYSTYGVLYNWKAATTACPAGWSMPNEADWSALETYLIGHNFNWDGTTTGNKIAKALAAKTNWSYSSSPGTPGNTPDSNNTSCFGALPGGRYGSGMSDQFGLLTIIGRWWSSTDYDADNKISVQINNDVVSSMRNVNANIVFGALSIRCIKD